MLSPRSEGRGGSGVSSQEGSGASSHPVLKRIPPAYLGEEPPESPAGNEVLSRNTPMKKGTKAVSQAHPEGQDGARRRSYQSYQPPTSVLDYASMYEDLPISPEHPARPKHGGLEGKMKYDSVIHAVP